MIIHERQALLPVSAKHNGTTVDELTDIPDGAPAQWPIHLLEHVKEVADHFCCR